MTKGEKWEELFKQDDDYWQRTTEKYEEHARAIEVQTTNEPQLMRSGINEFRNNRNFLSAEHYEEYYDGSLIKKIVNDNGYGLKKMIQSGQRLDVDKIATQVTKKTDDKGFFECFIDTEGNQYNSLKELVEKAPEILSWEYENETVEDIAKGLVTMTRKGKDFINNEEWHN